MFRDLTGQKFNKLTVIKYLGIQKTSKGRTKGMWLCKCDCGNMCELDTGHITSNHTKSCGCWRYEHSLGERNIRYVNGLSEQRIGRIYGNMLNRCYNKNVPIYKYYGERGIKVCDEWRGEFVGFKNFCDWAFCNGYTNELTLERIDNNGDYSPSNCRWATKLEQANNKRNTKFLKVNGEIDTVANWSRRLSVSYWNLLHYAKGGKNCKYPNLKIEAIE